MRTPLWIIAHRCNAVQAIDDAYREGANAVEFDVNSLNGQFYVCHGSPNPQKHPLLGGFLANAVWRGAGLKLGLAYLDYKGPDYSPAARVALERIVQAQSLGGLQFVFSVSTPDEARTFFQGFKPCPWCSPQIDQQTEPQVADKAFTQLGIQDWCYADGITQYWCEPPSVEANVRRAVVMRKAGNGPKRVLVWTLRKRAALVRYLRLGVDGILTDRPRKLANLIQQPEFAGRYRVACATDSF